jgi:hypothetical protein
MHILSDTNHFSETVNDEGVGGRVRAMAPPWDSRTWYLPAGGTLGFGQVGNQLGAVLRGRTLGTVVEA